MRAAILTLVLLCAVASIVTTPAAAQDHAYILSARLDPDAHTVKGTAAITWTNQSTLPQDHLFLHLYLNAFRDRESVFMRESGGQLRNVETTGVGGIEITSLQVDNHDAERMTEGFPEAREDDATQMRVALSPTVAPGARVTIDVEWVATLPPVFARSGYHGDFYMVGQWFPKVARLEPNGEWATFPYHGHGEFYADFATYDLTIDVPEDYVVGATGERVEHAVSGGRAVSRYVAERVHDTAFAAAPWFEEQTARFAQLGAEHAVEVRCLYPPGYDAAAEVHVRTALAGLAHFGNLYGPYPHPTLTIIAPPRGADGAAGMEYPTLFTTAGEWFPVPWLHNAWHEEVTAHELAHQWFQGLLASNEVAWPMLDEGLTSWATQDLLRALYGERANGGSLVGITIDGFEFSRLFALRGRRTLPPGRPANAFHRGYGRSVYARTTAILETVSRTWGRARFVRALGEYARRHRFSHPVPDDLFASFDAAYWPGFSSAVLRPAMLDGAIAAVRVQRLDEEAVVVERLGGLPIPTAIELHHDGGEISRVSFPQRDVRYSRPVADPAGTITGVEVDPDHHGLLDPDRADDFARVGPAPADPWFARLLTFAQFVLSVAGP